MSFANIFSKNPVVNEKIRILVDVHEKNSLVPAELEKIGFQAIFESLPVGDYVADNTVIERKTIQDLKSSIIDKRIHFQLQNLKQFEKHALLIEGFSQESLHSGLLHENALRGFILSTLLNNKVPIIFSNNEKDTAKYLSLLAKKSPDSNFALRVNKSNLTDQQVLEFIIQGFPEIGPATSKKLLSRFNTITELITASDENIKEVIGSKSSSILKFKSLKYNHS